MSRTVLEIRVPCSLRRIRVLQLLIATRNSHKTAEFANILGATFAVSDLTTLPDLRHVEETGATFEENATLKAVAASRVTPQLVVADDSGLEVVELGGAPGVYSARYAGPAATDEDNVAKLLSELRRVGAGSGARGRFCCALAVAREGRKLETFWGTVDGTIIAAPRGVHGFGYDPVFVPAGLEQTFADLGQTAKNAISHRANAIRQLRAWLIQTDQHVT